MMEELEEQIHERVYNIKVPTLGFSRRDLFNIAMEYAEPREKRIAELEKENAELKGLKDVATLIRANNDTVITLMQLNNMLVSKSQQLTKAKVLLERLLITSCNSDVLNLLPNCSEVLRVRVEAEQFLREVEK
jgi:hypothetical protein